MLLLCLCFLPGSAKAAPGGSPDKVRANAKDTDGNKMDLTEKEIALAKEIGFDEKVLKLIKDSLKPEMGVIKTGGLEPPDTRFFGSGVFGTGNREVLPKDRENYLDLERKYPELAPVIKEHLGPATNGGIIGMMMQNAMTPSGNPQLDIMMKRFTRFQNETSEYLPLMAQDAQDEMKKNPAFAGKRAKGFMQPFESDAAVDKAIEEVKAKYAGKKLRDENKATLALGLRFFGTGERLFQPDPRVDKLKEKVKDLGYMLTENRNGDSISKTFESRADAEEFLRSKGTAIDRLNPAVQEAREYQAIYPVDWDKDLVDLEDRKILVLQGLGPLNPGDPDAVENNAKILEMGAKQLRPEMLSMLQGFAIPPGATMQKTGDRRWLIKAPARYFATASVHTASVMKVNTQGNGIDMLRAQQTSAPNYDISTEMMIEKVKYWDKKYGATVLDANHDSFKIRFKNLPEDISELCSEIFLFCPEFELTDDENANASKLRDLASQIRNSHETSFWWD